MEKGWMRILFSFCLLFWGFLAIYICVWFFFLKETNEEKMEREKAKRIAKFKADRHKNNNVKKTEIVKKNEA